jgi:hypothetical protein
MKTKITFLKLAIIALIFFSSNNFFSQTYFYQDAVENGTIWHNGATDVSNPLSDGVNSSSTVLQNDGTASWQETQLFPDGGFTIQAGDKFYISFYNPNGAANWQLRMDLSTTGSFTQISGADPAHDAGAANGWVEVSLDLSSYEGEDITKIQLYPVAGENLSINYDNIYIKSSSGGSSATETYFFQDAVENGTIWHSAGSEVANPLSDSGNSSATVIQNTGAAGWEETQFFPTSYTIKSGDKFYMSVYNPNGAAAWQLKMDISTSGNTWIGEPAYTSNATSGWTEMSLDLSSYVGEDITKIFVYPAAGESKSVYYDTVYIHTSSVITTPSTQTYFFQDAVENGTIWHSAGSEVANPLSDSGNSSTIVIQNTGASGWEETQFFPTSYTIKSGDKFYMSVYNPNGAAAWQLKMDLSSSGNTWIGEPTYTSNATSGWTEMSLDLSSYVGEDITKIFVYPAAGESKSVYYDTIYIHTSSVISAPSTQTYFYQEAVENGTIWHNGVTDISNPLSDSVNSSSIVLQNDGTASWQETQLFPSAYTIQSGDKFYISFYNPNSAANWQLRMDLSTTGSFTQISGGDPAHDSNTSSGWVEVSLDLSSYVGESISKIQLYPVAGESISISYDNIYISSASVLSTSDFLKNESKVFVGANGIVNFSKVQEDATLYVFDVKGALILKEQINGNSSKKALNKKGLYFIKLKNNLGFSNHKVLFH